MMENMMNKLQNHSDEDEAMRLRMEILNKLPSEEQQKIKRGFGSQMRLTSFYEAQIQKRIAEQSKNAVHNNAGWDFGSGTGEQQDEYQEDFLGEPQQLEIRILNKKNKKHKHGKHQRGQKKQRNIQAQTQFLLQQLGVGQSPWTTVQLDELFGTAREDPRPVKHKTEIETTHQQKAMDIPKGIQHQQIAGEAAQVQHAPRDTSSMNENVRKVASSTDSIVSGQVGVAGTKPINIQTSPSTQLQTDPIREPKVEKKGGKTPVRGESPRTVPTHGNSEQNKGGDSYTRNLSLNPNGGNITTSTGHGNGGKNNSLSGSMETGQRSGIHTKRVFPSVQMRGQREEIVRETENLSILGFKRRGSSIYREIGRRIKRKHNRMNTSRTGQMVQSNIYNSEASLEMEENSGCECFEQGDINNSFQDECNRSSERFDKERRLGNKLRSKISLSPPNSISITQTISSIRSNGESLLIQSNALRNAALPNLLRTSTSNGSNEDTERVRHKNFELRRRSAPPTLEQRKIARINFDNNGDPRNLWMDNSSGKVRNRIKTIDQLLRMDLGLKKNVHKDDRLKETRVMLLVKETNQPNRETIQVREASLYLKLMDSAKTRALKNKEWKENIIPPKEILQELYWWHGVIVKNQEMTLEVKIPEAVMVSDASPKGWGVTLELQTGDTLVQHGEWNKEQKRWTS
ncbi:MAG: hypothetical protein EZS28_031344, partial [Streblomastix strix]